MTLTFRWYGPADSVRLDQIRQIPGLTGIVSACYDVPPGEAWSASAISELVGQVEDAGLRLDVIESVPVSEAIKLGQPERDAHIEAYQMTIERLGVLMPPGEGSPVVCYNFMPVFDWTRTDLAFRLPDGSATLSHDDADLGRVEAALLSGGGLPGWIGAPSPAELTALRAAYADVSAEQLWEHLAYFLERVVPVAEAVGVRLAIHPDDPPWPVFGLPRIVTSGAALGRVCHLVDSPANGVTLCTGSLGADPTEAARLPETVQALGERIHFAHLRNVRTTGPHAFREVAHAEGDVDLAAVIQALYGVGFDGPARPDHGRMIWDEVGDTAARPGYGLYDRALGATYLRGLWDGVEARAGVIQRPRQPGAEKLLVRGYRAIDKPASAGSPPAPVGSAPRNALPQPFTVSLPLASSNMTARATARPVFQASSPRSAIVDRIRQEGAVAVVRTDDPDRLIEVAQALCVGGVVCFEITMTVPNAIEGIQLVAQEMRDSVLIGAGSVLTAKQTHAAVEAGACYVVSPVFKREVVAAAHANGAAAMPGCFTPSEIQAAHDAGADVVKVFPAGVLGMSFFKGVLAPLPHLKLMPTGGVSLTNAGDWLRAGAVAVGVGSALVDKQAIAAGDWQTLTDNARTLMTHVRAAQNE
ncbi:MAG: mannonate dehydratase [Bacteroidota bacterium]